MLSWPKLARAILPLIKAPTRIPVNNWKFRGRDQDVIKTNFGSENVTNTFRSRSENVPELPLFTGRGSLSNSFLLGTR